MPKPSDSEFHAANNGSATDRPLLLGGPKAAGDSPIIDLEPVHSVTSDERDSKAQSASETVAPEHGQRSRLFAYAPIAAAIVFAVAFGAIAGAAATSGLLRDSTPTPSVADDGIRALQISVAQLGNEVATLTATITTAQRSSSAQFSKLTERLDRAEKTQAEPAAKFAKLQESIDRLERRQQQPVAAAPAPETTGSVQPPKEQSKPPLIAEGWRLRDYYDGRAVVESRNGALFRVGPGSSLPGLGRVEAIRRENGRVVVWTANGIISASFEQRRPGYYSRW